jgi:hypothetical protein
MVDQMTVFLSEKQVIGQARPARKTLSGLLGWVLPLALVPLLGGCGDGKPPLYPSEGSVFVDKKPAHGAVVWLHPVTPSEGKVPPRPHARVGPDGSFRLGTVKVGDGAAPGKYRVTIMWNEDVKSGDVAGKSLLPAHYQDLEKSGLPVVEIKEETNQLPPFHLTRQTP